ncbi:MAG: DUF393 domain-containing protein [Gammaproteobacteria bacterium]|nr:DUF393 domain-containing protein [Gammaproteobacteria bacterium]
MNQTFNLAPDLLYICYDAKCPLCAAEMRHLKNRDVNDKIVLVDIHDKYFSEQFPTVERADALRILHGFYDNKPLYALDVTYQAWSLVGKRIWVWPLQLPLIKQIAHGVYLLFARYRYPISAFCARFLKEGQSSKSAEQYCQSGTCYEKSNKHSAWRK